MHGAWALLVALAERAATGRGLHVESTMVESALNVAAEQVIEWSAYGHLLGREGNRSPLAAPQGLYPCAGGQAGMERWPALSIAGDEQWRALRALLGDPAWACDTALETRSGRRLGRKPGARGGSNLHLRRARARGSRDGRRRGARRRQKAEVDGQVRARVWAPEPAAPAARMRAAANITARELSAKVASACTATTPS